MSQSIKPQRHLIVYAKRPLPGYAKTRLGADLGEEEAAGFYARLLYAYLFDLLMALEDEGHEQNKADLRDTHVTLSVATPADVPFFAEAFPELTVHAQVTGDLGTRMATSLDRAFALGAEVAVLTGSDIPGLNVTLVSEAFHALERAPAVIGLAADGGYYLIGMRAPGVDLFHDIPWSTDQVLARTEALARAQGIALAKLPTLMDIDTIEAYNEWRGETRGS
jgi:hypothetical protein